MRAIALLLLFVSHIHISISKLQIPLPTTAEFQTCSVLAFQLPGRVTFNHDSSFEDQQSSYWAQNQGELVSACRVTPWDSNDLQQIMFMISDSNATFAIKSGGHSTVANTSNIQHGITIDLKLFDHVTVKAASGTIDVGTGARWQKVYEALEGTRFAVAGARAGSVGVGGYLLGGGISLYSGSVGWSCDMIVLMEVVLGNGTLLEVSAESHSDLFRVLKGGGSNFGVVTRFVLQLMDQVHEMNVVLYQLDPKNIDYGIIARALCAYDWREPMDPQSHLSVSVSHDIHGLPQVVLTMIHPRSVLESKIFARFLEIPGTVSSNTRQSQLGLAGIIDDMNPYGWRQHRSTITIHMDAVAVAKSIEIYVNDVLATLRAVDRSARSGLLLQFLTYAQMAGGMKQNMLGLGDDMEPLMLMFSEVRHSTAANDMQIERILLKYQSDVQNLAEVHGADHKFQYLNYAGDLQQPFEYQRGQAELWRTITEIRAKYDSGCVFQNQMRHPFRL